MEISEKIKSLREDKDLTQATIALNMGITRRQYIRYEKGEQEMTVGRLRTLCEFYGVSADYVLGLPKGLRWPRQSRRRTKRPTPYQNGTQSRNKTSRIVISSPHERNAYDGHSNRNVKNYTKNRSMDSNIRRYRTNYQEKIRYPEIMQSIAKISN